MAQIRSKRHRNRYRNKLANKLMFWAIFVIAIFLGVVWLSRTSFVEVKTFSLPAESPISMKAIRSATEKGLDQQTILIDRDNTLLYDEDSIVENVNSISGQISSVKVSASGLRTLTVIPELYTAQAQICPERAGTSTSTEKDCNYLSEDGYIFSVEDRDLVAPSTLFYTPKEKLVGTFLLPTAQFHALTAFIDNLEAIDLAAERVITRSENDVFIETGSSASSSTQIRINTSDDLSRVFSDLEMLTKNNSFTDEESGDPVNPESLEYIDLRFENKVFYK